MLSFLQLLLFSSLQRRFSGVEIGHLYHPSVEQR